MKTVVTMVHGSHLYGLNTENSDTDYKRIVLPTRKQILLQQANFQQSSSTGSDTAKNTKDDTDLTMFSLHKFIDMACAGETQIIDMLHNDSPLESSPVWEDLRSKRSMFYTSDMKAFVGYCKRQAYKYGIKGSKLKAIEEVITALDTFDEKSKINDLTELTSRLDVVAKKFPQYTSILNGFEKNGKFIDKTVLEVGKSKFDMSCKVGYVQTQLRNIYDSFGERAKQARDNNNVDWKAISHAIRAAFQLIEIYETGDLVYPLKERKLLLDIKQGNVDFATVAAPLLEELVERVETLASTTDYPKKVDREFWDKWLMEVYKKYVL